MDETHGLKHPENYSYQQIQSLIEDCRTLRMQALLCVLYGCGVRISECNRMEGGNIKPAQTKEGHRVLRVHTPTLKNRTEHDRFVYLSCEKEEWLTQPIEKYAALTPCRMFPLHRATLYRKVHRETGINPHGFRAIRGCHLVTEFGFNDQQLTKFMGWTDSRPARYYIRLKAENVVPGL